MSPMINDYLVSLLQLLNGSRVKAEIGIAEERLSDVKLYLDLSHSSRILDLANGRLRPQYYILATKCNPVIGVDRENKVAGNLSDIGYRFARWLYTFRLPGFPSHILKDKLVCADVSNLPIKSDFFDLVTSVAAFEHFLDVPAVVAEIKRVIRPGGLVWVSIHPFSSPSGGHNLSLTEIPLQKIPPGVDPWDHLRKRHLPFTVPLNEWRIHQYMEIFSHHFEILKSYCALHEGKHFLTDEVMEELGDYSREELTCCTYIIVARKPEN